MGKVTIIQIEDGPVAQNPLLTKCLRP